MNFEDLFIEAARIIKDCVNVGQTFEVKELFEVRWNTLQKGEKTGFGAYFSRQFKNGRLPMLEKAGETKGHHNMYRKLNLGE